MQITSSLATETATLVAAQEAIARMVKYLTDDDMERRERWLAGSRDPADYERRRRLWEAREQRARALRQQAQ